MKHSLLFLSVLALASLAACNRHDADAQPAPDSAIPVVDTATPSDTASDTASRSPVPDASTAASNDSLALGLLGAVNDHEIAAAAQAKEKKVSPPVLAYADMMDREHSANQEKTKSLGPLASNEEVSEMKAKGDAELAALGQKVGKDYETAYVDAMVKGHTEALTLIDTRLLTLASTGPIKQHLTDTRGHVAHHLEAAKKLQTER